MVMVGWRLVSFGIGDIISQPITVSIQAFLGCSVFVSASDPMAEPDTRSRNTGVRWADQVTGLPDQSVCSPVFLFAICT